MLGSIHARGGVSSLAINANDKVHILSTGTAFIYLTRTNGCSWQNYQFGVADADAKIRPSAWRQVALGALSDVRGNLNSRP